MDKIRIIGGTPLQGKIHISGAKNAALPLMCASLLTEETLTLTSMPYLADIVTLTRLLMQHGVMLNMHDHLFSKEKNYGHTMSLSGKNITSLTAPYELVRTMRASVLVLGPLLARFGQAKVSLPGGCAIGSRPIDLHLKALEALGAQIELSEGYVHAKVDGRLKGAEIYFDKVSVGATENLLMAAALAEGVTVLANAAREPEVTDLAHCLVKMGAKIEGIGSDRLVITGVDSLHGAEHRVVADRIEAGTYMTAAAMTHGDIELIGASMDTLGAVVEKYEAAGVCVTQTDKGLRVRCEGDILGVDVMTLPFPGFPTDMQAQFMALMSLATGASMITETIFENRFMHVPELVRMGANINVQGRSAMVRGVQKLKGAEVMATDLRASSSLILAALAAEGETLIHRVYHLDRGYEALEEKLAACGANIARVH
jgi:UDP-N-acetylglucosamine 1-carboxyvinyltransferase